MENLNQLIDLVGDSKAKKIVKLTNNCEKYLLKFKTEMDSLLNELNCEVNVGLAFKHKEE